MAGVVGKFRAALAGRPLLTNCITYGLLYGGAEFSQQTFIRKYSVSYFNTFYHFHKISSLFQLLPYDTTGQDWYR